MAGQCAGIVCAWWHWHYSSCRQSKGKDGHAGRVVGRFGKVGWAVGLALRKMESVIVTNTTASPCELKLWAVLNYCTAPCCALQSHGTHEWHADIISKIRKLNTDRG